MVEIISLKLEEKKKLVQELSKKMIKSKTILIVSTKNLPILPGGVIWRADVVKNRPQDVKAFTRGVFAAIDYVKSHPDESYEIIAKGYNLSKQEVIDQIPTFHWMSYQDNLEYFSQSSDPSVYSLINKTGDLWLKLGLIKKSTSANFVVDDSLLKSLNK